eukprot:TRINITY_DN45937_c0_g1_i1.p1 TRINITY_DN45937_c0_g1~~TRINITY_DN45937_c0_g1_i1.p1  ORF type:complete len:294 (+),score=59.55 TRINITY_DN45937_c0_g1_i1:105-986(+)
MEDSVGPAVDVGLSSTSSDGVRQEAAATPSLCSSGPSTHVSTPAKRLRPRAFATLLTSDDFLMAVQALVASLRAASGGGSDDQTPLLVMHTDQVSDSVLQRLAGPGLELRKVEAIQNPHCTSVPGWVNSGFTKLRLWEQDDFEKLVYIDADCLVLESIDELFDRPSPAFAPDVFPPDRFNAGVIVLEPSIDVFEKMMRQVPTMHSHDGGDTGFLNSFFSDWYEWPPAHRLPFRFNALRTMYWFTNANPGYWESVKPIKVLHFCSSPKPWDAGAKKGDLEHIWWTHYLRSQMAF